MHCFESDFLDTANIYGMGRSEHVLGTWLAKEKRDIVIASKVGIQRDPKRPVNNDPAYIRTELEGTLQRLGVNYIDLYYLHRRDETVPLEDSIGTMVDLMHEGKIGGYGLSEVAPYTLRMAQELHPCLAVQSEYSLWTRQPELGMIQACRDLGVTFVPFSPLARGVFGQNYPDIQKMEKTDFRAAIPRFQPDNYARNIAIIDRFKTYAADRGLTVSALAIAWLLNRDDHIIPVPGTRTAEHLADWAKSDKIKLSQSDMEEIEAILPVGFAFGDRYSHAQSRTAERYC
jgi:aryl-alcohol dehydrogenase-like predicted oxidoreductase